jgi:hypothetical protein
METENPTGTTILIFYKVDFKTKFIRRDRESHIMLIKGIIHQEEVKIVNIYVLNTRAPNFIKTNTTAYKGIDRHQYNNSGKP